MFIPTQNKNGGSQVKDEKIAPVHEAGHFVMQVIAHGAPPLCTMLYGEDDGVCWWLDREAQPEKSLLICVAGFAATAYSLPPLGVKSANIMSDEAEDYIAARRIYARTYGKIRNDAQFRMDLHYRYSFVQFHLERYWAQVCEVAEILRRKKILSQAEGWKMLKRWRKIDSARFGMIKIDNREMVE